MTSNNPAGTHRYADAVIEALSTGDCTLSELQSYMASKFGDEPGVTLNKALGQVIRYMLRDGRIVYLENRGMYTLPAGVTPPPAQRAPAVQVKISEVPGRPHGSFSYQDEIPEFLRDREPRKVTIMRAPLVYSEVLRVTLIGTGWQVNLPLFANTVILISDEIPEFDPAQESYKGVQAIRITAKGGQTEQFNLNGSIVTFAPERGR